MWAALYNVCVFSIIRTVFKVILSLSKLKMLPWYGFWWSWSGRQFRLESHRFPIEAGLEMDWTSCQSGLAICNPYTPGCYEG